MRILTQKSISPAQLSRESILQHLDKSLDVEFTFIRTESLADLLQGLQRAEQMFLLDWVRRIASTNIQLAHQFLTHASVRIQNLNSSFIESWALHAMDLYDKSGLHAAMNVIRDVDSFIQTEFQREAGACYEQYAGILLHFTHGLSGRKLNVDLNSEPGEAAFTDGENIFLPAIVAVLPTEKQNFTLLKLMVAFCWAQTRFGSFRHDVIERLRMITAPWLTPTGQGEEPSAHTKEPAADSRVARFLQLFHNLESLRLEACIQRELPGLFRTLIEIRQTMDYPPLSPIWLSLREHVSHPSTNTMAVIDLLLEYGDALEPWQGHHCHTQYRIDVVQQLMQLRLEREKAKLRTALFALSEDEQTSNQEGQDDLPDAALRPEKPSRFELKQDATEDLQNLEIELMLDGKPVAPPENVKQLLTSIKLDLQHIPAEYLVPAGPGEYDSKLLQEVDTDPNEVWQGTYHEDGASLYNEWDYRRLHYRKNWCAAREKTVTPVYDDFVAKTLLKHHGLIKHLRKTFEVMRDEDRLLRRQTSGDGVDIDALVEALADSRDGSEMSERLFTRKHRSERNIAVLFMVDMSGSTKGWINDAERESLVMLSETLETLGDRYVIYGFSGLARKRCEIFKIKQFNEPYNREIQARISGIKPQDYTRMGFAIRHLTRLLNEIDAKTRVLITLSDGKPDDYDSYRGEYGVEDTRRALLEARREGIHPYCITIDTEAHAYLPHMCGAAAYTVIDDVAKLPLKVSDIYRRLTS